MSWTGKEKHDMFSDALAVASCSWIESVYGLFSESHTHTLAAAAAKITSFTVFLLFTFTVGLLSRGDSACSS